MKQRTAEMLARGHQMGPDAKHRVAVVKPHHLFGWVVEIRTKKTNKLVEIYTEAR